MTTLFRDIEELIVEERQAIAQQLEEMAITWSKATHLYDVQECLVDIGGLISELRNDDQ